MKNCEHGRSMIEMLGVLAIVGVLSVGGLAGYSKVMHQYKINAALEQIAMISSKLSSYGAGVDSYAGLSNKSAYKLRAIPASAVEDCEGSGSNSPCKLINPFGGSVTVEPSNIEGNGEDEQAYAIIYEGLTQEACISIGSNTWFQSKGDSLLGIGVGKKAKKDAIKTAIYQGCSSTEIGSADEMSIACSAGDMPMDVTNAAIACDCPASDCVFVVKFF